MDYNDEIYESNEFILNYRTYDPSMREIKGKGGILDRISTIEAYIDTQKAKAALEIAPRKAASGELNNKRI